MKSALLILVLVDVARAETIQGTVLNSVTRQPIRKAAVTLTTLARDRSYAIAITDAVGHFAILDIPEGRFTLVAGHAGFLSVPYRSGLQVTAAQPHTPVTLLLTPATVITGKVTDPEGDGVFEASIAFYEKGARQATFYAVTDQHSTYRAGPMPTGEFTASASPIQVPVSRAHPNVSLGEKLPAEVFAPQTYPAPIFLRADRDTTDIDFHLAYAPQVSLHGTLSGIPEDAGRTSITLRASDQSASIRVPFNPTKKTYTLAGLAAGSYRLEAQAGTRRTISQVSLYAMGTEVNIALEPGISIEGSVKIESPSTVKITKQTISLQSRDATTSMNLHAEVDDGDFEFEEVPAGTWDVTVRPLPPGFYIKSMHLGQRDLLQNDMQIGTGPQGPLEIVISGAAPKVEGTVQPPQGATILAASADGRTYRTAQSDESGHFTLNSLAPGTYRFYAFQDLEPNAWQAPNFLRPYEPQSKQADLKEGATETLSLPVINQ